jgi:hypothetical protein
MVQKVWLRNEKPFFIADKISCVSVQDKGEQALPFLKVLIYKDRGYLWEKIAIGHVGKL